MNTKGIKRIIILELLFYYCYHEEADYGGNDTDAESSEDICTTCGWSNGNQSCYGTCTSTNSGWLLVDKPIDDHPCSGCSCSGNMGYEEGICSQTISSQTATCIESKPSQPKERHTHEYESNVVRSDRMTSTVIISLAYTESHDKSSYTCIDMNNSTTCKVDGSHLLQETASPYPVSHWKIGDDNPENGKKYISAEFDTLGKSTKDKGRSNQGEHALEHGEAKFWNSCRHD